MRFPVKIKFRRIVATIFGKTAAYPRYRVAVTVNGRRRFQGFDDFGAAKEAAEKLARELSRGSNIAALTGKEIADTIAVRDLLANHVQATGRKVTMVQAVSEYLDAARCLDLMPLSEAVQHAIRAVAGVRADRVPVATAVEEFNATRRKKTVAPSGRRPQLSPRLAYQDEIRLRVLAKAFASDVLDVTPDHLRLLFDTELGELSPKSRNHYRGTIRSWLKWSREQGYLPLDTRLLEAPALVPEKVMGAEIGIYSAVELRTLLDKSEGEVQLLIAVGAFAGLRTQELVRLDFADLWRRPGFIEVTALKSKTRARRLVPICPALQRWLEPWRGHREGPIWTFKENEFHVRFRELCAKAKVDRKQNALRHSFISYRLAESHDENKVAQQSGTSPTMIFTNYRQLATEQEAKEWFSVQPTGSAQNVVQMPAATGGK